MRDIEKHPLTRCEIICFFEQERDACLASARTGDMRPFMYQKAIEALRTHDFSADADVRDDDRFEAKEALCA